MSVSNEVLLDVQGLEKAYGGNQVLNGITTQIRRGEVVAIIGPSGCGKSTFLRSLNLLEEPTGGKILFEGTDITDSKVDINRHRQKIGMVFQQFNLFPHKTVKENIMLAPVTLKLMSKEEAEKKVKKKITYKQAKTEEEKKLKKEKRSRRERELLNLSGLLRLAEIFDYDNELLLGYLLQFKKITPENKKICNEQGILFFEQHKMQKEYKKLEAERKKRKQEKEEEDQRKREQIRVAEYQTEEEEKIYKRNTVIR
mgnify:CR=1 FL=1